jgi:hypothetical protein
MELDSRVKKQPICGAPVKTADQQLLPCLREKGHEGGHNPFSNTPPKA